MTSEKLIITLVSAAAVALLVAIAWLLGFRARASVADEAALKALIAESDPAAMVAHVLRDRDGRGALARLADGRWAAVAAVGDRTAVRFFPDARIKLRGGRIRAAFGDPGFPGLTLRVDGPAPDWLAEGSAR